MGKQLIFQFFCTKNKEGGGRDRKAERGWRRGRRGRAEARGRRSEGGRGVSVGRGFGVSDFQRFRFFLLSACGSGCAFRLGERVRLGRGGGRLVRTMPQVRAPLEPRSKACVARGRTTPRPRAGVVPGMQTRSPMIAGFAGWCAWRPSFAIPWRKATGVAGLQKEGHGRLGLDVGW